MALIFRGDGVNTSSITIATTTLKDTIPNTNILSDVPNTVRVIGDGGFEYRYRRGKPRTAFSLKWEMMPKDELKPLQALWNTVEMHHWFTAQTTDLSDGTTTNPIKNELFNLNTGSTVFARGSYDGSNPMPGTATNWLVINKWIIWTFGTNSGKRLRIVDFFSDASIQMEAALTLANGDKFFIGYPVYFTSPLQIGQIGNIRTHYNVSVDCEVNIS